MVSENRRKRWRTRGRRGTEGGGGTEENLWEGAGREFEQGEERKEDGNEEDGKEEEAGKCRHCTVAYSWR
jgi:hypothetical protein